MGLDQILSILREISDELTEEQEEVKTYIAQVVERINNHEDIREVKSLLFKLIHYLRSIEFEKGIVNDLDNFTRYFEEEKEVSLITPEQEEVLNQKREILSSGQKFALRFCSVSEHFQTLEAKEITSSREANLINLVNLLQLGEGLPLHQALSNQVIQYGYGSKAIGNLSGAWWGVAEGLTHWTSSSIEINTYSSLLEEYKKLFEEIKGQEGAHEIAKAKFIIKLFNGAKNYIIKLYVKGIFPENIDNEMVNLFTYLNKPNLGIEEEDRLRLVNILSRNPNNPEEFSSSDIRILMRFNWGGKWGFPVVNKQYHGNSSIRYEVLQIWDMKAGKEQQYDLFDELKEGSNTSFLLGAVALYPDRNFHDKITLKMINTSKDTPKTAHILISIKGEEYFPHKSKYKLMDEVKYLR